MCTCSICCLSVVVVVVCLHVSPSSGIPGMPGKDGRDGEKGEKGRSGIRHTCCQQSVRVVEVQRGHIDPSRDCLDTKQTVAVLFMEIVKRIVLTLHNVPSVFVLYWNILKLLKRV